MTLNHTHPLWAPDPGSVVLAWGHYLHSPEQLVLDVATPKLLLHRGPSGGVQHLQPHLRGGGEAVRPLQAALCFVKQAGAPGWESGNLTVPAAGTAWRPGGSGAARTAGGALAQPNLCLPEPRKGLVPAQALWSRT